MDGENLGDAPDKGCSSGNGGGPMPMLACLRLWGGEGRINLEPK